MSSAHPGRPGRVRPPGSDRRCRPRSPSPVPLVAPRIHRRRRATGGELPLDLGRQKAAPPGGVRLGLEPGDAPAWDVRRVARATPGQPGDDPVADPRPALRGPVHLRGVAAGILERLEGRVRDLRAVDPVARRERDLVGRLLAGKAPATQSGGPAASSLAMSAASVPIVNEPAGTQTCDADHPTLSADGRRPCLAGRGRDGGRCRARARDGRVGRARRREGPTRGHSDALAVGPEHPRTARQVRSATTARADGM